MEEHDEYNEYTSRVSAVWEGAPFPVKALVLSMLPAAGMLWVKFATDLVMDASHGFSPAIIPFAGLTALLMCVADAADKVVGRRSESKHAGDQ